MSLKIVVFNPLPDEIGFFEQAAKDFDVQIDFVDKLLTLETAPLAAGYQVVITQPGRMDEPVIKTLTQGGVRLMQTMSVGIDHVDFEAAKKYGMLVNPASYSPHTVAEFTVMLMLMTLRYARAFLARYEAQDYRVGLFRGYELQGKTVGVYGAGSIGLVVARLIAAFGAKVLAYSPSRVGTQEPAHVADKTERTAQGADTIEFVDLDRLLAESDILTLHARVNDETRFFFNKERIAKLKDGVVLINTARGELCDTGALIDALESGKIAAAGIDVLEKDRGIYLEDHPKEPVPHRNLAILKAMPNVVMFPHAAYYTQEAAFDYTYGSVEKAVKIMREQE